MVFEVWRTKGFLGSRDHPFCLSYVAVSLPSSVVAISGFQVRALLPSRGCGLCLEMGGLSQLGASRGERPEMLPDEDCLAPEPALRGLGSCCR